MAAFIAYREVLMLYNLFINVRNTQYVRELTQYGLQEAVHKTPASNLRLPNPVDPVDVLVAEF